MSPAGAKRRALRLPECTNDIWHGYLRDATLPLVYGYRAFGPYDPEHGHRFNPHKLLLDPYARELVGSVRWSDALFGYRLNSPRADLSFDRRDSASAMPKAVVSNETFNWGDDRPPRVPWTDTVIYEAHVRGSSMRRKGVRNYQRGGFAALGDPKFIDHIRRLGVTAVELLPIHAYLQDRFLIERGLVELLGLQHARLLRAGAALSVERKSERNPRAGAASASGRHRSDPRRGLQPHLRRQRTRADAVDARLRQRRRTTG